jgi:porphobilinogen synthase
MNRQIPYRMRRLRKSDVLRRLVRETRLHTDDLIAPLFVIEGKNSKNEIPSMPGVFQYSIDRVGEAIDALLVQGVDKIILFGIPAEKDELATNTYSHDGIIQKALQTLKKEYPQLLLITDVCFCEYTTHGHCGVIVDNEVHNDNTLELLAKQAVSHAESGADMVAPSGMMDNMVGRIRTALDESGYEDMPIMSYAVKYASAFYGPFRDAVDSTPQFGNRKGYQMDPANLREALSEAELDVTEGADILMVKPALAYLDVVKEAKATFNLPIACYNVSGEYSMLKAAAKMGWINHDDVLMESLLAMKRAGADMIITYSAGEAAALLKQQN